MTVKEAKVILHASGLSIEGKQYRDHYYTDSDDETLCKLVTEGYFSGPHGSQLLSPRTGVFYLTDAGIKAAWKLAGSLGIRSASDVYEGEPQKISIESTLLLKLSELLELWDETSPAGMVMIKALLQDVKGA